MRVTVIGTGYVGLVTGTCLADMGNHVVCHDIDRHKIDALNRGEIPIYEPRLEDLVVRNREAERLEFTTNLDSALQRSEIVFIAVGTPPQEDGRADLKHVLAAATGIADAMTHPLLLVVKSTVPVGTCHRVKDTVAKALAARGANIEFHVASNPEFLKEGAAVDDFMRPDRIIFGTDHEAAAEKLRELYRPFVRNGHPVLEMDVRSSEMSKYAANAMLATRISLMNEIANLCEELGADVMAVRRGVGSDSRLGMAFLYPGVGYGGSCFPKDVRALATMGKGEQTLLRAVEEVNTRQKERLARRIAARLAGHEGATVAVWGLAFKAETDDVREAPALTTIRILLEAGFKVRAHDPMAIDNAKKVLGEHPNLSFHKKQYDALKGAHALALITEWRAFRTPDFTDMKELMAQPLIFDGRNQYEPEVVARAGFEYHGVGRAAPTEP